MSPKSPPSFSSILQKNGCFTKMAPFYIFRHYAAYRRPNFFLMRLLLKENTWHFEVLLLFLSLRYGADLGRSRLVFRFLMTFSGLKYIDTFLCQTIEAGMWVFVKAYLRKISLCHCTSGVSLDKEKLRLDVTEDLSINFQFCVNLDNLVRSLLTVFFDYRQHILSLSPLSCAQSFFRFWVKTLHKPIMCHTSSWVKFLTTVLIS